MLERQVAAIPLMKAHVKPQDRYVDITIFGNLTISFGESRALLRKIGIPGEILCTPGHSDDSVPLLLDDGSVLTGDWTPPALATEENAAAVAASWQLLCEHGGTRIYPGDGPIFRMR